MNEEVPTKIRPFIFHGLTLSKKNNEYTGPCPFCDKEKFSVNSITGLWKCWSCATGSEKAGGNISTFIQKFHDLCVKATKPQEYSRLAEDRGFVDGMAVIEWQLALSVTTGDWLVPGYNHQRTLCSLYRYIPQREGGHRLIPTPTVGHHIHGMNLWDSRKPVVYICEGPWDAIALWECLVSAKNSPQGLILTASRESSLAAQANVIAVPGCEVFFETWLPLFDGKIVNLVYDSDHPRKHPKTGHITDGAGWRAMRRVTEIFSKSKHQPEELNCIQWGPDGYDPKRKSGFDVRDFIVRG